MDEALIANWNSKVAMDDIVYHLGDFSMGKKSPDQYLSRLNGLKILIRGNHDKRPKVSDGWSSIHDYLEITHAGQMIVMCHYAMRVWNKSHRGSWMLYGHSHGSLPDDPNARSIDVGVDCHQYNLLDFADLQRSMNKKSWKPIDHHGSE